jgi:hypothetical protein
MKIRKLIMLILGFVLLVSCTAKNNTSEIAIEKAVQIAANIANDKKYNTQDTAIEAIKYKKEIEKGPIRLDWLLHTFSRDEVPELIKNDFWLIYFYPKKTSVLGGDFIVLVDLNTGKVIATKTGK